MVCVRVIARGAADNVPCQLINYMLFCVPKGLPVGPVCYVWHTVISSMHLDETAFC